MRGKAGGRSQRRKEPKAASSPFPSSFVRERDALTGRARALRPREREAGWGDLDAFARKAGFSRKGAGCGQTLSEIHFFKKTHTHNFAAENDTRSHARAT